MNTNQRVAIVTGSSRGIGKAIAQRLATDGFATVVNYSGNAAAAEATVAQINAAEGHAVAIQADVSNSDEVARLFQQTLEAFGHIDAVVNSAGVMPLSPIAKGNFESFDRAIAINLRGAFAVLSQAAQHLKAGGRIIALSSSVVVPAFPTYGPYVASKAGVEALMRVLANELRGRGITVNVVAPGPTGTELFLEGKSEADIARFAKIPPLERLGMPEDVANLVSFLCGPEGGWINAQVLRSNGGFA